MAHALAPGAPLLFEDDDRKAARRQRDAGGEGTSVAVGRAKAQTREIPEALPMYRFRTLLDDLASVVVNVIRLPGADQ